MIKTRLNIVFVFWANGTAKKGARSLTSTAFSSSSMPGNNAPFWSEMYFLPSAISRSISSVSRLEPMVLTTRCLRFLVLTMTCTLVLPDLLGFLRKNMMQR